MKKILKSLMILVLSAIVVISGSISASAVEEPKEWNNRNIVDSIVFEKVDLKFNETTMITVNFSFKGTDDLKPGDTLTLYAPDKISLYPIFGESTIQITTVIDGQTILIGTAVTNSDNSAVVVTFNENVGLYKIVSGLVYFTGSADWVEPENAGPEFDYFEDHSTTLGTDGPTVDYVIRNKRTTGTASFFSKPNGIIYPEHRGHIYWTLNVNRNVDKYYSDVKITDTMHDGQKFSLIDESLPVSIYNLAPEYFYITLSIPGLDTKEISVIEFVEEGYGTISFDPDNPNKFEIVIFKNTDNDYGTFLFTYYAKITDTGKLLPQFYNEAEALFTDKDGNPIRMSMMGLANNIFEGGQVVPTEGALRIVKLLDLETESIALPGVSFKLFHQDGSPVDGYEDPLTTNELGYVDTDRLDPGEYYIQEVDAPGYVEFDPTVKYPFLISAGNASAIGLTIHNQLKTELVHVQKVWNDTFLVHPEVTINLLANNIKVDELKLNHANDWKGLFDHLPMNDSEGNKIVYTVSEDPIDGYESVITPYVPSGFVITNTLITDISATKTSDKNILQIGDTFDYTITVSNDTEGSLPLSGITIEDNIPVEFMNVSSDAYVNGVKVSNAIKDNKLSVEINNLSYGYPIDVTFTVKVLKDALGDVTNTAKVINPFRPNEPLEPTNKVKVVRPEATIGIEKSASKEELEVGEEFEYSITIKNLTQGSDPISKVIMKDTLPNGIVFTDSKIYIDGVYSFDATNNSIEVPLLNLTYGENVVVSFMAKSTADAEGTYINQADAWDVDKPEYVLSDQAKVKVLRTTVPLPEEIYPTPPTEEVSPTPPDNNYLEDIKGDNKLPATGVSSHFVLGTTIIGMGILMIAVRKKWITTVN